MKHSSKILSTLLLTGIMGSAVATAKPLKVYILAGQSNMVGHATTNTLPYMLQDPATVALHNRMVAKDGKPIVHENVYISLNNEFGTLQGPLTARFGAKQDKIGPELAFGFTMYEKLQEPILLIKTAWGGKSLHTDFRPPSAGPYVYDQKVLAGLVQRGKESAEEINASKAKATGQFYRLMLDHVKKVLADPGQYHPAYNKEEGCEIAGFVWFQGYNDAIDTQTYPNRGEPGSYDAYSVVLGHFIRDIRKELNVPQMPFVIGVLGVSGSYINKTLPENRYTAIMTEFQKAMAAPADLPEFKGNVFAVHAGLFWDRLQATAEAKKWPIREESTKLIKQGKLAAKEQMDYERKRLAEVHTPEEAIAYKGVSNQAYHYLGSAKILSRIGEALAEALINKKGNP
jgi:alpha-galactosidase